MRIGRGVALSPLLAAAAIAVAQDTSRPELPTCNRLNSSRLAPDTPCGAPLRAPVVLHSKINLTIKMPPVKATLPQSAACRADVSLVYGQYDTVARVDTVISNTDCAASRGKYALQAHIRDSSGASKELRFDETWERQDDQPIMSTKRYPIGHNVDLLHVRVTGIQCTCIDPPHRSQDSADDVLANPLPPN